MLEERLVTSFQGSQIQCDGRLPTQLAKPLQKTQSPSSTLDLAIFALISSQQASPQLHYAPLFLALLLKIFQLFFPSPNSGQFCLAEVDVLVCLDYFPVRRGGCFGYTSGCFGRKCWSLGSDESWREKNMHLKKVKQMKRSW